MADEDTRIIPDNYAVINQVVIQSTKCDGSGVRVWIDGTDFSDIISRVVLDLNAGSLNLMHVTFSVHREDMHWYFKNMQMQADALIDIIQPYRLEKDENDYIRCDGPVSMGSPGT